MKLPALSTPVASAAHHTERSLLSMAQLLVLSASLSACVATAPTASGSGNTITDALRSVGTSAQSVSAALPALVGLPVGGAGGSTADALGLVQLLSQSIEAITEAKEIEIGRDLAAVLLGAKPALKDARIQRYVNELGRWLALHSSRPNLPWLFVVLDDGGVNAFAAPGGFVFITKGLLDRTYSEAELAGVLAHEIVHVEKKHHLQALGKSARAGLATQLVASQVRSGAGSVVASQLMNLGKNLYSKGLDRSDEFEADAHGVSLATRAGLDPFGLPSVLQTLSTVRADDPAYLLALATHPPTSQRLASLQAAMAQQFDGYAATRQVTVRQRVSLTSAVPAAQATPRPKAPSPVRTPAAKPVATPPSQKTR